MPSAQCSGSQGEAVACKVAPGNSTDSSTATAPSADSAQRVCSKGYTWLSTAYTAATSQAVTDKAGAKPKRGSAPKRLQPSKTPCNSQASQTAARAAPAPKRAAPAADTA